MEKSAVPNEAKSSVILSEAKSSVILSEAKNLIIFLNAAALHAFYIFYTPTWERQHDVIGFRNGKGIGQAALIEYLMENGHFPDFDPTKRWGFFQPLLHHVIAAALLKVNLLRGMNYDKACESIQVLTFIYSLIFIFYGFRILKLMGLEGRGLFVSETLLALHPVFVLLSGSVNNDMLSHMFFIMAVFYVLRWQEGDRLRDLLLTALCIGLSMMAKLSGVLVAPAVAFLMLYRLYKDIREKKNTILRIGEYALFGAIAFPLGMIFPLRNLLLFGVPLTYMPKVGEELTGHSALSRIFDIRTDTPYACMIKNGDAYDEFNVFLLLIKTGLTGEYDYGAEKAAITPFAWILFISGVLLFATVVVLFICVLFKRKLIGDIPKRVFWVILIMTGILFMVRLMFKAPNFSSGDIRYIAWIMVPAAMLPGLFLEGSRRGVALFIEAVAAAFALSSAAVYVLLGL